MATDYVELYKKDARFRRYVDCCAKDDRMTPEEKMREKVIQNVGDYYAKTPMSETEKKSTSTMSGGGC